jgi:hypothetical protein
MKQVALAAAVTLAGALVLGRSLLDLPWAGPVLGSFIAAGAALAAPNVRSRRACALVAGLLAALLFTRALGSWALAAGGLLTLFALAPLALARPFGALGAEAALAVGVGALGPGILLGALASFGGEDALRAVKGELGAALPGVSQVALAIVTLVLASWLVLAVLARALPEARNHERPRVVAGFALGFTVVVAVVLGARLLFLATHASVPHELVWSEPPLLTNLMKLREGEAFYGPLELCNSYSYSPLLELTHRTLLAPFGWDLSIRANRVLGLVWQAASIAVLAWALAPHVLPVLAASKPTAPALVLVGVLACTALSSLLSAYLHPDHPLMLCFSGAIALVVAEQRIPRRLFVVLLVAIPPLATAFKLTGAGLGVGLVLAFAVQRRLREVAWLALSGALALATIPLFDATLGPFSSYAIELQASHDILWRGAFGVLWLPEGQALGLALVALGWAALRRTTTRAELGVACITLGTSATSLIAFLKYGGRTNSLLPLALGSAVIAMLVVARADQGSERALPRFLPALAAWLAITLVPPARPLVGADRASIVESHELTVRALRDTFERGKLPLSYTSTAAWIAIGRRDPPPDRAQSAAELYLGRRPELASHFGRLADGRYDVIVTATAIFSEDSSLIGRFGALRKRKILEHYELVEPRDALGRPAWPPGATGVVVLRRRADR